MDQKQAYRDFKGFGIVFVLISRPFRERANKGVLEIMVDSRQY
ncbi:hypothetical protein [Paenibacillus pasadenensis]|nr:hypothetical protein [Paenibacillus pasadenensis]